MKISVTKEDLSKVLNIVSGVAGSERSTMPILAYVKIEAGAVIKVTTTDLNEVINVKVDGTIEAKGAACIPMTKLRDIAINSNDGDAIVLETTDTQIKVRSGKASYILNTLPAESYPNVEADKAETEFAIKGTVLADIIGNVSFAISKDTNKGALSGLALHGDDQRLKAVGCDGHRLAVAAAVIQCFSGIKVVPFQAVKKISQIAENAGEELVTVSVGGKFLALKQGDTSYMARLMDAAYPEYGTILQSALGSSTVSRLNVEKKKMVNSLRLSNLVNDKTNSGIALEGSENNALKITASNANVGNCANEVDISDYAGDRVHIGFNGGYLLEGIAHMPGENVNMSFGLETGPMVLRTMDSEYPVQILMPVKLTASA